MESQIQRLWITYDAACGLCAHVRDWIQQQAPLVGLQFVASGSVEARTWFPQLPPGELAVVADTGEVWLGDRSWIVCLWALRDYRAWAVRLSSPGLLRLSREAFSLLSNNRAAVSSILGLRSDVALEQQLLKYSRTTDTSCGGGLCAPGS
jgi:predicted DCC family thiol-disulfide oxidoreductase YuxK